MSKIDDLKNSLKRYSTGTKINVFTRAQGSVISGILSLLTSDEAGDVDSVNGKIGDVVLTLGDVSTDADIKTAYENNTNTNVFTDTEKTKLSGLESSKFLGEYATLGALESAHPAPAVGSYANVDTGVGTDVARYVWDVDDAAYILQLGVSTLLTDAQVKTQYENNADTNAYTDAEKTKLSGVAPLATANDTDANLKARANHTGTQTASTISDFDTEVSNNSSVTANTAKVGITPTQASDITANNAKVGITPTQASDITANNAKVGITPTQASDITTNNAKVGITPTQASDITTNNAKVGITPTQASDIVTNNAKVSNVSTNLSEANPSQDVVRVDSSDGTNATLGLASSSRAGIMSKDMYDAHIVNNAKVGITPTQASDIVTNNAKVSNVSTNLSEGNVTNTTVDVNSSDGTNATLAAASTSRAGVMTKALYDNVIANNAKISAPALNVLGIANASGVYTYYTTYPLAIAAASSGDVIEQFGNITTNTGFTLPDGVNINGHGYTYENTSTGFSAGLTITTYTGFVKNLVVLLSNAGNTSRALNAFGHVGHIDCFGSTFTQSGTGFASYFSGTSSVSNATIISLGTNLGANWATTGTATNCTFSSVGGTGVSASDGEFIDCAFTGNNVGMQASGTGVSMVNCRGEGVIGDGIRLSNGSSVTNCIGISVSGVGIRLQTDEDCFNSMGISSSGAGVYAPAGGGSFYGMTILSTTSYALYCNGSPSVPGNFHNCHIESNWDNVAGYPVQAQGTSFSNFYNCSIVATNAGAAYLNNTGGATTLALAGNIFKGGTAWAVNITNSIVSTSDAQGNILT